MADEVSKTGVYYDTKTGKVVSSAPEEGIQLVPAGGTIDANTAALIQSWKDASGGEPAAPKTVTTTDSDAPKGRPRS